jgi:hypothetical protein
VDWQRGGAVSSHGLRIMNQDSISIQDAPSHHASLSNGHCPESDRSASSRDAVKPPFSLGRRSGSSREHGAAQRRVAG